MSVVIRDNISPELSRLARKINDPRPLLEAMGIAVVSISQRSFKDESLRPTTWPALKPETIKRKKGYGGILRGPGAVLQKSIHVGEVTKKSVTVETDRPYAFVHQFGSSKSSGRGSGIPARPFFPFTKEGELTPTASKKVESVLRDKITKLLPK